MALSSSLKVDVNRGSSHLFLKNPNWRVTGKKIAVVVIVMKTKTI